MRALALSARRPDVGVRELVAFEQQRFTCGLCKRIGKAIAEIQLGGMTAAFAEISIASRAIRAWGSVTGSMMMCASLIRSSNRRLATGARLASMMTAASTKLAARAAVRFRLFGRPPKAIRCEICRLGIEADRRVLRPISEFSSLAIRAPAAADTGTQAAIDHAWPKTAEKSSTSLKLQLRRPDRAARGDRRDFPTCIDLLDHL